MNSRGHGRNCRRRATAEVTLEIQNAAEAMLEMQNTTEAMLELILQTSHARSRSPRRGAGIPAEVLTPYCAVCLAHLYIGLPGGSEVAEDEPERSCRDLIFDVTPKT